jgi:hypothetical protein
MFYHYIIIKQYNILNTKARNARSKIPTSMVIKKKVARRTCLPRHLVTCALQIIQTKLILPLWQHRTFRPKPFGRSQRSDVGPILSHLLTLI